MIISGSPPSLSLAPLEVVLPPFGALVLESHHARDFQLQIASHDFFQLLFVAGGQGVLHCPDFAPLALRPGDLALLPIGARHGLQDDAGAPLSIYALNLAPRFLETLPPVSSPLRLRREALAALLPPFLRRMLLEQSLQQPHFEAMLVGLALELLSTVFRFREACDTAPVALDSPAKARVWAYRAELERTFIYGESVDEVAARLGLSRRHFTGLFRQLCGDSWLGTVRALRINHAQKLLLESNRTVLSVAFECGFEELSSFYRAFKALTGESPDCWRKAKRGQE